MIEMYKTIDWDQYKEILNYGNPPVYMQMLILIGLAVFVWLWRTVKGVRPMTAGRKLKYKILFIVGFALILFQERYNLRGMIDTVSDTIGF